MLSQLLLLLLLLSLLSYVLSIFSNLATTVAPLLACRHARAVKAGDDLRQEQLASQFFALAHRILKQSPLRARAGLRYLHAVNSFTEYMMRQNLVVVAMYCSQVHAGSDEFHIYSGVSGMTKFVRGCKYVLDQRTISFFVGVTRSAACLCSCPVNCSSDVLECSTSVELLRLSHCGILYRTPSSCCCCFCCGSWIRVAGESNPS